MEKLWYVITTYVGHEDNVKEKLEARTESMGMQENIFRVIIPTTTEVENKDGVKKEKTKKMFPGYVFVEMVMRHGMLFVILQELQDLLVLLVKGLNLLRCFHKKLIVF